jgi:hypothetical protein
MTGNICVYCPGGPDSDFEYSTQSYTGYEPTSMRAIRARYNPYLQTTHRIEQVCEISGCHGNKYEDDCLLGLQQETTLKHLSIPTRLHSATSQKTVILEQVSL